MIHRKTDKTTSLSILCLAAAGLALAIASPAAAQGKATRCHLYYDMSGWSFIYKTGKGTGRIECADGQKANVKVTAHGGGFTLGTQSVKQGHGRFSGTFDVKDLFGTYIEADAHAGVGEGAAVDVRGMFKGGKRLSLVGKGDGITIGFAFGGFTIAPQ